MKTFNLSAKVTISVYTKVQAETIEEAVEIANERSIEPNDISYNQSNYCWVSDEFDGEVFDIKES